MSIPKRVSHGIRHVDWRPFCTATVFCSTLLLFVPGDVYLANKSDLLVFFGEAMFWLSVPTLVLIAGGTGILSLLRGGARERAVAVVLGVTGLLWIHAYLLVWRYGVLDGSGIDWAAHATRGRIDVGLWMVVLAVAWWRAPAIYRRASWLASALFVLQLASLTVSSVRSYDSPLDFFKNYYVEKEHVFDFSPRQNVMVIVLDEFQSDIFSETILNDARYAETFEGFTYFPDAVAGFNYTEIAIPALLTGRIYDNRVTREAFLRDAYLERSLPAVLKRRGFDVHLYPWRGFANESIYYHEEVATNFKRRPVPLATKFVDLARLVDLALFRSLPQFGKRFVHNGARWRLTAVARNRLAAQTAAANGGAPVIQEIAEHNPLDHRFLEFAMIPNAAAAAIAPANPRPTFKFFHLAGLHVPVKFKRDLTYGNFDYNRANFSEQAEAYAKIMAAFLDGLRAHDLYDNSLIIIVGDHGSGRDPELFVNPGPENLTRELDARASGGRFQHDKARGIPLLLVKRIGARGPLHRVDTPASNIDVPATVLAELGMAGPRIPALPEFPDFAGTSLFGPVTPARARYYGAMMWAEAKSDYVNPISLYRVQGFSWDDASWSFAETLARPE